MTFRCSFIVALLALGGGRLSADETLYRYEADEFSPCHASHGWSCGGVCVDDCSDSVEDGHFVVRFARGGSDFGYGLIIAPTNAPSPPPIDDTFWAEWRFRSNCPLGTNFITDDAFPTFHYSQVHDTVNLFGDATVSSGGNLGAPTRDLGLDLSLPLERRQACTPCDRNRRFLLDLASHHDTISRPGAC